jgi:acyl carrier protein
MDKNEVLTQVTAIFHDVLDNSDIALNYNTTVADVDEWDSLNHIQIVVAIEKHFKIKFTTQEIQQWKNVGEICDSVLKRLPA